MASAGACGIGVASHDGLAEGVGPGAVDSLVVSDYEVGGVAGMGDAMESGDDGRSDGDAGGNRRRHHGARKC